MARSKSKNKRKRHKQRVRWKHRLERKKTAARESRS
jgi:hypothetical protein